jgi:uncharacterized protein YecE (DUF72 family)
MSVIVGTSGWQYADWRFRHYAKGVPQRLWFEHVMRDFRTVELNVTFCRLPKIEVFAGWRRHGPWPVTRVPTTRPDLTVEPPA